MKKTMLLSILTTILIVLSILSTATVLTSDFTILGRQAGTTLSANVTASAIYLTEYKWSISKEANASAIYLSEDNSSATVEYTVSVTKTAIVSYYVEGCIRVNNGGGVSTENLAIKIDLYYHKGGGNNPWVYIGRYPVDVSAKPVLGPGESYCYYYKIYIPEAHWSRTKFKVDANVTITNHSGRLGEHYGPSPAATSERTLRTEGYNCVDVTDTNGFTWSNVCSNSSWIYTKTFTYDPALGGYYEYVNIASIDQTSQSASWTVEVHQEIRVMMYATISGVVFWDNNYNGVYDGDDKLISGVAIHLYKYDKEAEEWVYVDTAYSNEYGYYYFEVEVGYTYKVEVVKPVCGYCDKVVNTTPTYYEIDVEEAKTYSDNDFGFVCLKRLTGAYSKGYWSWSQYNKRTGLWQTRVTLGDVSYINSELGTGFSSTKELADYLVSPVLGDMSTALRQQLIATLLNLRYGYISGDTVVYYNGSYITINEVVSEAKTALQGEARYEQEYWKDLLDAINNNYVYYVHAVDSC